MDPKEIEAIEKWKAERQWTCDCGYMNLGYVCSKCGKTKDEQAQGETDRRR